jgi:hypothetical protein
VVSGYASNSFAQSRRDALFVTVIPLDGAVAEVVSFQDVFLLKFGGILAFGLGSHMGELGSGVVYHSIAGLFESVHLSEPPSLGSSMTKPS